jgi:hypothetical protein
MTYHSELRLFSFDRSLVDYNWKYSLFTDLEELSMLILDKIEEINQTGEEGDFLEFNFHIPSDYLSYDFQDSFESEIYIEFEQNPNVDDLEIELTYDATTSSFSATQKSIMSFLEDISETLNDTLRDQELEWEWDTLNSNPYTKVFRGTSVLTLELDESYDSTNIKVTLFLNDFHEYSYFFSYLLLDPPYINKAIKELHDDLQQQRGQKVNSRALLDKGADLMMHLINNLIDFEDWLENITFQDIIASDEYLEFKGNIEKYASLFSSSDVELSTVYFEQLSSNDEEELS